MAGKSFAGRIKVILAFLLLFGPAIFLIFIGTRGCAHKFKVLDDYGTAIDYTFVSANGDSLSSKDYKGNIVLITTLQPTCPNDCAVSLWHLNQHIYETIRTNKKKLGDVRMISFVTDGEGNPVEDLSSVYEMLEDQIEGYNPELWTLASGDAASLYDFESNGEALLREGDEYYGGHAFQEMLLLLDKKNHLRMVLPGNTEGLVRRMKEHMALLLKQYDKEAVEKK